MYCNTCSCSGDTADFTLLTAIHSHFIISSIANFALSIAADSHISPIITHEIGYTIWTDGPHTIRHHLLIDEFLSMSWNASHAARHEDIIPCECSSLPPGHDECYRNAHLISEVMTSDDAEVMGGHGLQGILEYDLQQWRSCVDFRFNL